MTATDPETEPTTGYWQELTPPLAVRAVFGCPLFQRGDAGWVPLGDTQPAVP
jgi:hypothetical protein